MITIPRTQPDFVHPKLKVIGLGGAGCNALDRLVLDGLTGAEVVGINTDIQALTGSVAPTRVQIGQTITRGLGTGGDPEIGRNAAEECADELRKVLSDATIVFVLAGLGGGTGSGALPVLADLACEQNAFVVVLGTMPFEFEGKRRTQQAEETLKAVRGMADLVICFENDRMGDISSPSASVQTAFATADQTLSQCVRAMTALVHRRGLLKVGFDEIGSALRKSARSFFGYGEADGDNRAHDALAAAFKSPLLDSGRALKNASSVVVQIVGGTDFTLNEMTIAMEKVNQTLSEQTRLFMGTAIDPEMTGRISISIFCGAAVEEPEAPKPASSTNASRLISAAAVAGPSEEETGLRVEEQISGDASEGDESAEKVEELEDVEEGDEVDSDDEDGAEDDEEYEDDEEGDEEEDELAPATEAGHDHIAAQQSAPAPHRPPLVRRPVFAPMNTTARRSEPAPARPQSGTVERARQEQMHFEPVNRGRFEKSEPTIIDGQDLDVPTFMRRRV